MATETQPTPQRKMNEMEKVTTAELDSDPPKSLDINTVILKKDTSRSEAPEPEEFIEGKTDSFGGLTKVKKGKALHKRNVYITYLVITFAFGCIQSYPSTLIPQFQSQIDSSDKSDIQWLFAVRSLGYCVATIFVGVQLDFFNNTHYFASFVLFIAVLPFIFMSTNHDFNLFIIFWFIIGFVTGTLEVRYFHFHSIHFVIT